MRSLLVVAFGGLLGSTAHAAVYYVGDTQRDTCDYATLQEAIDAATANGPQLDTILVTNSIAYTNVAAVIGDKSLLIQGGFTTCASLGADAPADLSGDGFDPVVSIRPSASSSTAVTLRGLRIHGGGYAGSGGGSDGGGAFVSGGAFVTIADTIIENNNARVGGGICIQSNSPTPTVQLDPGVRIRNNVAQNDGGGVFLNGGALNIVADDVSIANNGTQGSGGGVAAFDGLITIGNPGQQPARHDVTGVSISGNTAAVSGGGMFLATASARMYAWELILDANAAGQSGGGLALTQGAYASLARDYAFSGSPDYQCPAWLECSRLSNNTVGSVAGTKGGAVMASSGAWVEIAQTLVRGNSAQDGSALYMDDGTIANLEGLLVTANQSYDTTAAGVLMHANFSSNAPRLKIAYSTFAGNQELGSNGLEHPAEDIVAAGGTQLSIYSTAFYDSAYPITAYAAYTDDCVVRTGGAPPDPFGTHTRLLETSAPGFNNSVAGDYRLRSESTLNDYCDASAHPPAYRDLVLTPRCHDDPRKTNTYGACDVGAYESDQIFGNGFD